MNNESTSALVLTPRNQICILLLISFFSISSLPINPTYVIAGIPLFGTLILVINNIKIQNISLIGFFCVLAFALSQFYTINSLYETRENLILLTDHGANNLSVGLFTLCFLLGTCTYEIGIKTNINERVEIYHRIPYFLLPFLLIELAVRLLNYTSGVSWIYAFKHGLFYFDSNFLGITLLLILCFYKFLHDQDIYKLSTGKKILLVFFLIMTVSRAAILAYLLSLIVLRFKRYLRQFAFIFGAISFGILYYTLAEYSQGNLDFKQLDGSFNSKFYILNQTLEFYLKLPLDSKFFGIGLANLEQYIGIFAHNILVTFIVEFGIIGSGILLYYLWMIYSKSKGMTLYIYVPTLIVGFSLFSAYSPHLFILTSLILVEYEQSNQQTNTLTA